MRTSLANANLRTTSLPSRVKHSIIVEAAREGLEVLLATR
jgi:hypothetical protein